MRSAAWSQASARQGAGTGNALLRHQPFERGEPVPLIRCRRGRDRLPPALAASIDLRNDILGRHLGPLVAGIALAWRNLDLDRLHVAVRGLIEQVPDAVEPARFLLSALTTNHDGELSRAYFVASRAGGVRVLVDNHSTRSKPGYFLPVRLSVFFISLSQ